MHYKCEIKFSLTLKTSQARTIANVNSNYKTLYMKKTLLTIIYFLACIFSIHAQILYGTTTYGGNDGGGTINKFIE